MLSKFLAWNYSKCHKNTDKFIKDKRAAFKRWKSGKGTRLDYDVAKRNARRAIHHARFEADKQVFKDIDFYNKILKFLLKGPIRLNILISQLCEEPSGEQCL